MILHVSDFKKSDIFLTKKPFEGILSNSLRGVLQKDLEAFLQKSSCKDQEDFVKIPGIDIAGFSSKSQWKDAEEFCKMYGDFCKTSLKDS